MEKTNSFTNDLLDILASLPTSGVPHIYYQNLVNRLAEEWDTKRLFLFARRPFSGRDEDELEYYVYSQHRPKKDFLKDCEDEARKINLSKSCVLKELAGERDISFNMDTDSYLKNILIRHDENCNTSGPFFGSSIKESGIPAAFILAPSSDNSFLKLDSWEIARRVISLAVAKIFYVYDESAKIHKSLSEIAQSLQPPEENAVSRQDDILQRFLDHTRKVMKAETCALFLVDTSGKSLVLERVSGGKDFDFRQIPQVQTYFIEDPPKKGNGVTPWVLYRKKPFNARNYNELVQNSQGYHKGNWDKPFYGGEKEAKNRFRCVYMTPLLVGDGPAIGVLKYENRTPDAPRQYFDQSEERTVNIMAELIANLVISQRIERSRYDKALPAISNTLISSFGQPSLYEKLLDECRLLLHAQLCSLFLVDSQNNLMLKEIVGVSNKVKAKLRNFGYPSYHSAEGLTPWILGRSNSLNVRSFNDLRKLTEGHHKGLWDKIVYHGRPNKEFKSLYSIPLIIGDEKIGVFKVENKEAPPYYFTESDERLFDLIGRLIAIGVKYDNEHYLGLMLRAAEIGFLASGVAHEFNNYLQQFISSAGNIKDWVDSDDKILQSEIESLLEGVEIASQAIDNFRSIRDRGNHVCEFELDEILNQLVDLSRRRFENNGIDMAYENVEVQKVRMNPAELQTIVVNLLKNGFDSIVESRKQNGKLRLRVEKKGAHGFSIEVADSGKGLSEAELQHMFAPFYTTKGPGKGMGMGLYWVQQIVERNKGKIHTIPNNDLGGATFIVTLREAGHNA